VNTYVNLIFLYFILNTFAKNYRDKFSLCNYGVLCVDG
jgi:hypothetical protein